MVVRHAESGAVNLLSQKVDCAVINAGDGQHEHPTQALLDALTIRRRRGTPAGPAGGDLRRHPAQPRRALEHPSAADHGRPRARGRPADPDADRHRPDGRRGPLQHAHRPEGRRHRDDAAAADRAHAGRLRAVDQRVLPLLRPRPREAEVRQARRADHASRPDEPRRRDRLRGRRRPRPLASSTSRSRWASPCAWPASTR